MRALIDKGIDLEVRDGWGRTPLQIGVVRGDLGLCRLLIEAGANVNAKGEMRYRGETALCIAASWGNVDPGAQLCRVLLDAGARVGHRQRCGWTALHYAAANSCIDTCIVLIESGASIEATTYDGRTIGDVASPGVNQFLLAVREAKELHQITSKAPAVPKAVRL